MTCKRVKAEWNPPCPRHLVSAFVHDGECFSMKHPNIHAFLKSHWIIHWPSGEESVPFGFRGHRGTSEESHNFADLVDQNQHQEIQENIIMIQCHIHSLKLTDRTYVNYVNYVIPSNSSSNPSIFFQLRTCERNSGCLIFTTKSTILKQFSIGRNWNYVEHTLVSNHRGLSQNLFQKPETAHCITGKTYSWLVVFHQAMTNMRKSKWVKIFPK